MVLCRSSQKERPGSETQISTASGPPQPPRMVEQMAPRHLLPEEAWSSQEGLRLATDKAEHPVWLPVHTRAAGPAGGATEFKGTASLGPTSRAGRRKGSFDLLIVRDGTTFALCSVSALSDFFLEEGGGVEFSCHYCVFLH